MQLTRPPAKPNAGCSQYPFFPSGISPILIFKKNEEEDEEEEEEGVAKER